MTTIPTPKTIGAMNGKWAKMFKAALIACPIVGGSAAAFGRYAAEKLTEVHADVEAVRIELGSHGNRLTAIESSRFTLQEGREIKADIAALKEQAKRIPHIEDKLDRLIELQMKGSKP